MTIITLTHSLFFPPFHWSTQFSDLVECLTGSDIIVVPLWCQHLTFCRRTKWVMGYSRDWVLWGTALLFSTSQAKFKKNMLPIKCVHTPHSLLLLSSTLYLHNNEVIKTLKAFHLPSTWGKKNVTIFLKQTENHIGTIHFWLKLKYILLFQNY